MPGDPLRTPLCQDLGLEFPVVAFSHCKDVVAAVTNAGGLGVLGSGRKAPEEVESDIRWIRERVGGKAFGVDVLIPASVPPSGDPAAFREQIPPAYREFIERVKREYNIPPPKPWSRDAGRRGPGILTQDLVRRQLEVVLENRVPVLASGLGNPAFILDAAHRRGMRVFGLVGTVRQAVREAEAGVDYIVAQGYDAGGHTGEVGTFTLVPLVVDAVRPTPVLLAGGVGCGRHLAAALCLGAVGVWTGTIWLTAHESDTDPAVKERILQATERDTVRSRCATGKPVRQLRNTFTDLWDQPDAPPPLPMPLQSVLVEDILQSAEDHHLPDFMFSPAGQVVGMIREMKRASQILLDLVTEAQETLARLQGEGAEA